MASHHACCIALAVTCLILPLQARAQVTAAPGDRVRVVDASNVPVITGELVRLTGDSVSISTAATHTGVLAPSVWSLEGQNRLEVGSLRRHTLVGIEVGMLVGATLGKLAGHGPGNCTSASGTCMGLFAGAALGGILGYRATSETWRRVDYCLVCVAIAPTTRGALLTASIAF